MKRKSIRGDVRAAIDHLYRYGYCVLEGRLPEDVARSMAERFLELHADAQWQKYNAVEPYYQTLYGMLNLDDRVWTCASHPDVVAIAKHFLGDCIVGQACSKPNWPGAPHGGLHADDTHMFKTVPPVAWLINTMWMLTDFTEENGATGVVPMSHKLGLREPPPELTDDSPLIKAVTGRIGSVILWHGGTFHMSRANTSDEIRVGLNVSYFPRWYNIWSEEGHQPTWPETYARMPREMKRLCPGRFGYLHEEVYERF